MRYTAADASSNTNQCTFRVTVADIEPPRITCPGTVRVPTNTGAAQGTARWVVPQAQQTVTDNSNLLVSVTGSANSGDIFPIGSTVVSYMATDLPGNSAQRTFLVIVQDLEVSARRYW